MRDPARIHRMIEKLRALWLTQPDTRLGQLVSNLSDPRARDVFYVEDDHLEAAIDRKLS